MRTLIMMLLLATIFGCNDAAMSGSGGKKSPAAKKEESRSPNKERTLDAEPEQGEEKNDDIEVLPSVDTSADQEKVVEGRTSEAVQPDEIVDGQEVINDCRRCEERAKQLSPRAGFQADIRKTMNEGFYKVDPSRGLCDIHWMADMNIRIADHDGQDSVLDRQVALYCPCACGWAKEDFGPPEGSGSGGFDSQNGW